MRRALSHPIRGLATYSNPLLPKKARLVEVGLRDGLQNEKNPVSYENRLHLLNLLYKAGLRDIEAGAFVSPKWVPQMAGSNEIFSYLQQNVHNFPGASFSALVPNKKGLESAIELGVKEIAIFGAASESFSRKNINCSIEESIKRFEEVCKEARQHNLKIRGYVSCVVGCPYEGRITPEAVLKLSQRLLDLGCYEISLGDTIGVATPGDVSRLLELLLKTIPAEKLAVHFHDTYGQALANIYTSLTFGIQTIDSSVSGLGGCPYAKGASGNVATEDVVYMLSGLGIEHGISMPHLLEAAAFIDHTLQKTSSSKTSLALRSSSNNKKA
eukprot:scaffold14361_cov193-Ochromonas_danica.AAC.17